MTDKNVLRFCRFMNEGHLWMADWAATKTLSCNRISGLYYLKGHKHRSCHKTQTVSKKKPRVKILSVLFLHCDSVCSCEDACVLCFVSSSKHLLTGDQRNPWHTLRSGGQGGCSFTQRNLPHAETFLCTTKVDLLASRKGWEVMRAPGTEV